LVCICRVGPRRAGDVAVSYADGSKAERLLGWRATISVQQAVLDSWNWQSKNPNGFPILPTPDATSTSTTTTHVKAD
jgi:UDP-glucose 4-epimerase